MSKLAELLGGPDKRIAFVMGQPMNPCPKCGGYNLRVQTPIKIDLPDGATPKQMLGAWARASQAGAMMEGPVFVMCADCRHKGPSVDCTGRTRDDVGQDKSVSVRVKQLWNTQ